MSSDPRADNGADGPTSSRVARGPANSDFAEHSAPSAAATGRAFNWPVWISLLLAAATIYELTEQIPLSVAVLCVKFGLNDVATAFWIRRRDPWKARGNACSWFFVAMALAKAWGTGSVAMYLLLALHGPKPLVPAVFVEATLIMAGACVGHILCVFVGATSALRSRTRVWVNHVPAPDRRDNVFPPIEYGFNRARIQILCSVVGAGLIIIVAGLIWWITEFGQQAPGANAGPGGGGAIEAIVLGGGLLALPLWIIGGLAVGGWLSGRVCARTHDECWGESVA